MLKISSVLAAAVALIALSASMSVITALLNAYIRIPFAGDLIYAFMECFKAGLAALLGVLAGYTARERRTDRQNN